LVLFKERVDERARRRRRKDREERRRELEIQRAEDAKWGRTKNQPIVRLDSQVHFPGFISPNSLELPNIGEDDTFVDISPASIERGAQQSAGMSFAQVVFFSVFSSGVSFTYYFPFTRSDVA
jgi:hypothetical protein